MPDTLEKDQVVHEDKTTGVPDAVQEAVEADLLKLNTERESGLRTFQRGAGAADLYVSDIFPFPEEFSLANLAPTSYLAQPEGTITGNLGTQKFSVIEERLKGLLFDKPARDIERSSRLMVVKALKPTGNLVQLPLSPAHNGAVMGDTGELLGMRVYTKKGFLLLWDSDNGLPIYCYARNCWAAAMRPELANRFPHHRDATGSGYCSYDHMAFVEPRKARDAVVIGQGMFESGATTTRSRER